MCKGPVAVDECEVMLTLMVYLRTREGVTVTKPENISQVPGGIAEHAEPSRVARFLDHGATRFKQTIAENKIALPDHGAWETALVLDGEVPAYEADRTFLDLIDRANQQFTGWPTWLVTSHFSDPNQRPYVNDETWEELVVSLDKDNFRPVDFQIFDPRGRFFMRRALQEDMREDQTPPLALLDYLMPGMRVAEALAVGCGMARAMGCDHEKTTLAFSFRWTRLRGRTLTNLRSADRSPPPGLTAKQDEITCPVEVPLATPITAVALLPYVEKVVRPLHRVFGGFVLDRHDLGESVRYIVSSAKR